MTDQSHWRKSGEGIAEHSDSHQRNLRRDLPVGMVSPKARGWSLASARLTLNLLSRIERLRPLDIDEQKLKDSCEAKTGGKRLNWHWTPRELREIDKFISRRARAVLRPFEANNDVVNLALRLGRSYWAVHRRIERRRKEKNCSDAGKRAKG